MATQPTDFVTSEGLAKVMNDSGGGLTVDLLASHSSASGAQDFIINGGMDYKILLLDTDPNNGANVRFEIVPTASIASPMTIYVTPKGDDYMLSASDSDINYRSGDTWCRAVYGIK